MPGVGGSAGAGWPLTDKKEIEDGVIGRLKGAPGAKISCPPQPCNTSSNARHTLLAIRAWILAVASAAIAQAGPLPAGARFLPGPVNGLLVNGKCWFTGIRVVA
jgi:hypothetical protein